MRSSGACPPCSHGSGRLFQATPWVLWKELVLQSSGSSQASAAGPSPGLERASGPLLAKAEALHWTRPEPLLRGSQPPSRVWGSGGDRGSLARQEPGEGPQAAGLPQTHQQPHVLPRGSGPAPRAQAGPQSGEYPPSRCSRCWGAEGRDNSLPPRTAPLPLALPSPHPILSPGAGPRAPGLVPVSAGAQSSMAGWGLTHQGASGPDLQVLDIQTCVTSA